MLSVMLLYSTHRVHLQSEFKKMYDTVSGF